MAHSNSKNRVGSKNIMHEDRLPPYYVLSLLSAKSYEL